MTKLYYTLFNFIALALIIYSGVDMSYKITRSRLTQVKTDKVETTGPAGIEQHKKPPFADFQIISGRNLFGSLEKASGTTKEQDTEGLPPTTLNLTLLGTVSGAQKNARAVILDSTIKKQELYQIGDSIQNAVIKNILREKVVLRVGDKDEVLTMAEPSSSKEPQRPPFMPQTRRDLLQRLPQAATTGQGATITVNRVDIQTSLKDVNQLLSQARIQPYLKDGNPDGLAISRIQRGSIFSKLGLRNGDVIQDINGKPLNNPEDISSLYEKLQSGTDASLKITRGGRQQNLNYRFK